jgi:nucleotide-binding universal stress UspA family protein
MNKPVLVPLDGSDLAERALPYAATLARTSGRPLLLLHVLTPTPPRGGELVHEDAARAQLNAVAERLRTDGLVVETVVSSTLRGRVAQVITDVAQRHGCDLIVMSTHGRGGLGRWLYGSVADEVLRRGSLPLVLVSVTSDHAWPTTGALRVLVPFDGSAIAEAAIKPMLASVSDLSPDVLLLQVVVAPRGGAAAYMSEDLPAETDRASTSLERLAETLRADGWHVRIQVIAGGVAASIANVASEERIDVIAMATHGRSGLARQVLGSVATETLQRATTPLLLLRPPGLQHAGTSEELRAGDDEDARPMTFLVALDLKTDAALESAAKLARACGGRLVLVNVFRPSTDTGHVVAEAREAVDYVRDERRLYLDDKAQLLTGLDVQTRVETLARGEEVDQRIAAVAGEIGADILVVVSKRLSSTAGILLGSYAQGIVRLSPCPVLIVSPALASVRDNAGSTLSSSEPTTKG